MCSRNVDLFHSATLRREIDGFTHILNYSTGEVMSFDVSVKNIDRMLSLESDYSIPSEVQRFFTKKLLEVNSRKFRSNLIELGMKFSFPTIVNIELNKRCNLNCIHCYLGDQVKIKELKFFDNMNIDQINKLADKLHSLGVFLVVLTGGEPFLNQNIKNFIEIFSKKGFVLEIFTNLQFIPKWFFSIDSLIGRIQTSIYSSSNTIHDQITSKKGSYEKTMKNIKLLRECGMCVEVATPLMKLNFEERNKFDFFNKYGILHTFAWPIVNQYEGIGFKEDLNISLEQAVVFEKENPGFFIRLDLDDKKSSICAAAKSLFAIMDNGDVWPCSCYPKILGNIQKTSIDVILKSVKAKQIIKRTQKDIYNLNGLAVNFCQGLNFSETGSFKTLPLFVENVGKILKERRW